MRSQNKNFFITTALTALVILMIACGSTEKQRERYATRIQAAALLINGSIDAALSACRAVSARWQLAIVSDEGFDRIKLDDPTLHFNREEIDQRLATLDPPPEDMKGYFDKVREFYRLYLRVIDHADHPQGRYETYLAAIEDLENARARLYGEINIMLVTGNAPDATRTSSPAPIRRSTEDPRSPRDIRLEQMIQQLEKDTNLYHRAEAARSLGRLADERAVPALLEALEDPSWQVHIAAAWALKKITGSDYQMNYNDWKAGRR